METSGRALTTACAFIILTAVVVQTQSTSLVTKNAVFQTTASSVTNTEFPELDRYKTFEQPAVRLETSKRNLAERTQSKTDETENWPWDSSGGLPDTITDNELLSLLKNSMEPADRASFESTWTTLTETEKQAVLARLRSTSKSLPTF